MGIRFGAELRRRRLAVGLSLQQLAEKVHYDKSFLSRVERGARNPTAGLAQQCDSVLKAAGGLTALVPHPEQPWSRGAGTWPGLDAIPEQLGDGLDGAQDRQERLRGLANDEMVLQHFRLQLQELRAQGHRMTPLLVYPALMMYANLLEKIHHAATGHALLRLRQLLAHFYEYASWMAQEQDRHEIAFRLIAMAERLGAAGGADYLVPYAMIRRADFALYRGDGRGVVDLAAGAADHPAGNHWVRMAADQRLAQGFAMLHDRRACEAALARADRRIVEQRSQVELPVPLGSAASRSTNDLIQGWCRLDLGEPGEAAQALQRGLAAAPAYAVRIRVLFGVRLAMALAMCGEVAAACTSAAGLLGDSKAVDSAAVRHQLYTFNAVLNRWSTRSMVRELQGQLTVALEPA